MAIIGIDLGTTNCLVSTYQNGEIVLIPNSVNQYYTSSAVSMLEDSTVIIGDAAKERLVSHPGDTAAYFKQFMGTKHELQLDNKIFNAHELSAILLKQLKKDAEIYLQEPIEEVIISVPAYFDDNQRSATKLAAKLAGLQVNRLINEPSAAALYYQFCTKCDENKLLVIDFGGGTLDVSVVDCFENIVEIIAISGDNHLGGQDIDKAIAAYFYRVNGITAETLTAEQRALLYRKVEQAKISLNTLQTTSIKLDSKYSLELTKELMAGLCQPLFMRVKSTISNALKSSRINPQEINDIVLVGGSSQQLVFIDFIEGLFATRPYCSENADQMVAKGLGICCGMKSRTVQDIVMTDVCPFSLGVGIHNPVDSRRLLMSVLIERCSLLPISHSDSYYTVYDNQTTIKFQVYQGERFYVEENLKIGEVEIRVPPALAGKESVNLTFTYDIDGILHIVAEGSKQSKKTVIVNPALNISKQELAAKIKELEEIKTGTQQYQKERLLVAKLERLYCELLVSDRDRVAGLIVNFEKALRSGSLIEIKKMTNYIEDEIIRLEMRLSEERYFSHDPDNSQFLN